MTDPAKDREFARNKRLLATSERRRAELEHLIDTGHSFQRRVLAQVEEARAELEVLNAQLQQEQRRTDSLLTSIMPTTVADELKKTGGVVPRRYEAATVMFADFVSFTAHAEALDPLILVQILDQYYSEFDRIAARHNVEKVKTIGDAYMCVSGMNDDIASASNIVAAAFDFLHFVRTVRPDGLDPTIPLWQIRIGINSGPISSGVIGQDRLSFDVWGHSVNTAARVVAACRPNDVLLSRDTYDLLRDQSGFVADGTVEAKGRGPVEVFRPAHATD